MKKRNTDIILGIVLLLAFIICAVLVLVAKEAASQGPVVIEGGTMQAAQAIDDVYAPKKPSFETFKRDVGNGQVHLFMRDGETGMTADLTSSLFVLMRLHNVLADATKAPEKKNGQADTQREN